MKKIIVKFLLLLSIFVSFQGSCSKVGLEVETSNKSKTLKHNYIVLASVDGSAVEVEVSYSVFVAGNSENIVKTETLTTPFVIGGEDVKVVYDSVVAASDKHFVYNELKRNYTPKGADYLEIKNLSNVDLEYCVVGNQPLKYCTTECVESYGFFNANQIDKTKVLKSCPIPIYKDIPVLYLIKPELAPQTDVYVRKSNPKLAERESFKAPDFGGVVANTPFSASQIIDLYKREYIYKEILYFTHYAQYVEKHSIGGKHKELEHYGVIPSNQTLSNSGQIWFINTRQGFYGSKIFEQYGE
ncbi:hypothetical protein CAPN008_05400 [Capnocytophaga canis]|uniref:hypothetical protein n=1 Tax=Capnocytophaga canis TaxID=1848903 RepID=UPI001AD12BA6|nr:hypothetical protein [Capnocytophaga canis]GIM60490.1 hypothetical protein CAPN008_05400 [Capnocytophaga canis]